ALIVADVSRMASLIIMGQLQCGGMLRYHLRLQRIDCANAFAGFGTCLFERHAPARLSGVDAGARTTMSTMSFRPIAKRTLSALSSKTYHLRCEGCSMLHPHAHRRARRHHH